MANRRPRLVDQVIDELIEATHSSELKLGDRLPPEHVLVERFRVSRGTLREAMKRMEAVGMVSIRQGDGTYLDAVPEDFALGEDLAGNAALSRIHALDILEVRQIIEIQAVRLAAERAQDRDLREMEKCITRMRAHADDASVYWQADSEFHRAVIRAAKNVVLDKMVNSLWALLEAQVYQTVNRKGGPSIDAQHGHEEIFAAIKDRDPERAFHSMKKHLTGATERLFGGK